MKKLTAVLSLVAVFAVTLVAYAAVIFNPATGMGSVGKGDVQTAFGWNNAALQQNAAGVTFLYRGTQMYEFTCEWYTGPTHNRKLHQALVEKTQNVSASVSFDARVRNQITGFILNGWSGTPTITGGSLQCNQPGATMTEGPTMVYSTGGLYAKHNGTEALLP